MNVKKQEAKLLKTMTRADVCASRKQARKLIRKANKIQRKLKETDI